MKEPVDILDATPSKRLYLSIIADYDVNKAMCELIDNALDIWVKNGRVSNLEIKILLDKNQQRIYVIDNAGGISEDDLSFVVGPGHTGNIETDQTIGIFGVGTKRAVVALAQDIRIRTRQNSETFQVDFDDDWLNKNDDWQLPYYRISDTPKGTTEIELLKLRRTISDETISQLESHLGATYAEFLKDQKVTILLNDNYLKPITFNNWAFPPNYEPRIYTGIVSTKDNNEVRIRAIAGLTKESSPAGGEYGVYFYCNDRLIARALKTFDVGFATGLSGKPHADISLARILVSLNGEARLMPWNSSKSDINPSHEIFLSLRGWLLQVVKDYTSLSRRLSKFEGGWPENVFKYKDGEFKTVEVTDFPSVNTSYLPHLPESRPRYARVVQQTNKAVFQNKPWTIGLCETIIAVDWILKQKLEQRNRITLILLDSTLEIAFKEYLVNESGLTYNDTKLQNIFADRTQVHNEVKNVVKFSKDTWKQINHYYQMRCQLIHRRASVSIDDRQIYNFRFIVQKILHTLFNLNF
jgi:hypothetical protein